MGIVKSDALKSKVKLRRCKSCKEMNCISADKIMWMPFYGYYNEKGGYYYFICQHCKERNIVPTWIVRNF